MEASSSTAFDTQQDAPQDDPFGQDGQGDFTQDADPFAQQGEVPSTAPVVDREGNEVAASLPADNGGEPSSASSDAPVSQDDDTPSTSAEAATQDAPNDGADGVAAVSQDDDTEATGEAPKTKKGDARRAYMLFVPEGRGRYAEVAWHEKEPGKPVPKGTHGAVKQTVVLAANNTEALAFGYAVLGEPADGCSLVATTAAHWKVRKVVPKTPPVQRRLSIS